MQLPLPPPPPPPGALDFFSEHFDALRALYTKGLQPPIPKVKVLDNVVKCRLILPPELPDSWSAWNAAHPKIEPSEVHPLPPCKPLHFILIHCAFLRNQKLLSDMCTTAWSVTVTAAVRHPCLYSVM